ncbi:hypothetical protein [Kitasatospora cineracea]|uniref:hypothetical protein n=1 Tax=Kitasatospora cineracea TaxID=88074 RepID=UPI0033E38FC9
MADRAPLRPGPDSTTDLVLHEGGGSYAWVVPLSLAGAAQSLMVPVMLGAITATVAIVALVIGADAATVARIVLVIAAVEAALAAPLLVWRELTTVRRLRFAPAQAPTRFRTVRAARPGPWQPITQLCGIRLEHRLTAPYPGDQRPATDQLTVRFDLAGDELKWNPPAPTLPQRLHKALTALLGPAGVRVELVTERTVRTRPGRGTGWNGGGSASANSGGFSGGG